MDTQKTQIFERLIFQRPKLSFDDQAVAVRFNETEYQPGDFVDIEVEVDPAQLSGFNATEEFYASVAVTDVSSFQKVPKKDLYPSLGNMMYIEREVRPIGQPRTGLDLYNFQYGQDYVDHIFEIGNADDSLENLELLLGIQFWRRYLYTDRGRHKSPMNYDEHKFIGTWDTKVCARKSLRSLPNQDPGSEPLDSDSIDNFAARYLDPSKQGYLFGKNAVDRDFMALAEAQVFREYMHKRRYGFDQTNPVRIDYTETVAFMAANELKKQGSKLV